MHCISFYSLILSFLIFLSHYLSLCTVYSTLILFASITFTIYSNYVVTQHTILGHIFQLTYYAIFGPFALRSICFPCPSPYSIPRGWPSSDILTLVEMGEQEEEGAREFFFPFCTLRSITRNSHVPSMASFPLGRPPWPQVLLGHLALGFQQLCLLHFPSSWSEGSSFLLLLISEFLPSPLYNALY